MDASNPIISQDRTKMSEMRAKACEVRRQDFKYLDDYMLNNPRKLLPVFELFNPDINDVRQKATKMSKARTDINSSGLQTVRDGKSIFTYLEPLGEYPVSNIMIKGVQVHPPSINMKAGRVHVNRNFGVDKGKDEKLLRGVIATFDASVVYDATHKYVFCLGTARGFEKRLKLLMSRKCSNPHTAVKCAKILDECIPVGPLPDWSNIMELYNDTKIVYSSSAGFPYCKSKRKAIEELEGDERNPGLFSTVLQAILDGTLTDLKKSHPELFLVEVKNKQDRYVIDKIDDKCRPYVCIPFHFSVLFSMIVQPFCSALEQFCKIGRNAYGFSAADGGYLRLHRRLEEMKDKECIYGCYGDDVELFYKKGSDIWAIDPDFRQMDGSVDYKTVQAVALWMQRKYSEQHGTNQVWKQVSNLFVRFATRPDMIIQGQEVWRKIQSDGILSGVVGTTLFDTAKSVIAYEGYVEELAYDVNLLFNEEKSTRYFKERHGLEVKSGTWNPVKVNMTPEHDTFFVENKFLGMRRKWWRRENGNFIIVPALYDAEWAEMMCSSRNTDLLAIGSLACERRSFDRARGLMVTGAVFNERANIALNYTINEISHTAILMQVQADGGRGEKPADHLIVGEKFQFENSSMVPTAEWTADIYDFEENRTGAKPFYVFGNGPVNYHDPISSRLVKMFTIASTKKTAIADTTAYYIEELDFDDDLPLPPIPESATFGKPVTNDLYDKREYKNQPLQQLSSYVINKTIRDGISPNDAVDEKLRKQSMDTTYLLDDMGIVPPPESFMDDLGVMNPPSSQMLDVDALRVGAIPSDFSDVELMKLRKLRNDVITNSVISGVSKAVRLAKKQVCRLPLKLDMVEGDVYERVLPRFEWYDPGELSGGADKYWLDLVARKNNLKLCVNCETTQDKEGNKNRVELYMGHTLIAYAVAFENCKRICDRLSNDIWVEVNKSIKDKRIELYSFSFKKKKNKGSSLVTNDYTITPKPQKEDIDDWAEAVAEEHRSNYKLQQDNEFLRKTASDLSKRIAELEQKYADYNNASDNQTSKEKHKSRGKERIEERGSRDGSQASTKEKRKARRKSLVRERSSDGSASK